MSKSTAKYNINKIAGNIKKSRSELGLTRDELSKKAKVNYNTIIKLESGANKNPTVKTLLGIAGVFNTTVEALIS
jgi:DNA-binding XRE family transcriptional regulator